MKAKRVIAWLLVCVLQLGVCLLIPLRGRQLEQNIEKNGESYRFAVRMVTRSWDERRSEVDVDFPLTAYNGDDWKDTIVRVLETDADGLTRLCEKPVTFEELEQMNAAGYQEPPLYSLSALDATLPASDGVYRDLKLLRELLDEMRAYISASADGTLPDYWRERLLARTEEFGEPALRDLAQRQIEAENGDELFDSYVTGVFYQGEIYLQEAWVAGIHVASIHN